MSRSGGGGGGRSGGSGGCRSGGGGSSGSGGGRSGGSGGCRSGGGGSSGSGGGRSGGGGSSGSGGGRSGGGASSGGAGGRSGGCRSSGGGGGGRSGGGRSCQSGGGGSGAKGGGGGGARGSGGGGAVGTKGNHGSGGSAKTINTGAGMRTVHHEVSGRRVVYQPERSKSNPVTGSDVATAQRYAHGLHATPVMQIHKQTPVPAGVKQMAAQGHVQIKRGGAGCGGGPQPAQGQLPGRHVIIHPARDKHHPVHSSDVHRAERFGHGLNARGIVEVPKYTPVPADVRQDAGQAHVGIWKK